MVKAGLLTMNLARPSNIRLISVSSNVRSRHVALPTHGLHGSRGVAGCDITPNPLDYLNVMLITTLRGSPACDPSHGLTPHTINATGDACGLPPCDATGGGSSAGRPGTI